VKTVLEKGRRSTYAHFLKSNIIGIDKYKLRNMSVLTTPYMIGPRNG